jgi:hypothetical protein
MTGSAGSKKLFHREQQKKEATQLLFSLGQTEPAEQQLSFLFLLPLGAVSSIDGNRGEPFGIYATGVAAATGKKPTFDARRRRATDCDGPGG